MEEQETGRQKAGGYIFAIAVIFCSMEMVPGWGFLKLGWPPLVFYIISGVCGAIGGMLYVRCPGAGFMAGAVAALGALFATALVLEQVDEVHSIVLVIVGLVGILPGVGLYYLLRHFFYGDKDVIEEPTAPPALKNPSGTDAEPQTRDSGDVGQQQD
ncbi:MAG: hypothetical protein RDV41_05560 [Planctomycetota bacterium]|nr:hypothetical protein [Planctomycetota bacterium]